MLCGCAHNSLLHSTVGLSAMRSWGPGSQQVVLHLKECKRVACSLLLQVTTWPPVLPSPPPAVSCSAMCPPDGVLAAAVCGGNCEAPCLQVLQSAAMEWHAVLSHNR